MEIKMLLILFSLCLSAKGSVIRYEESISTRDISDEYWNEGSPEEEIKILSAPPKNTESVENVLEMLQNEAEYADKEEKCYIMNLIDNFQRVMITEPSRYAGIIYNGIMHNVDMGTFGTKERLRNVEDAENYLQKIKRLLWELIELIWQYFTDEEPPYKKKARQEKEEFDTKSSSSSPSDTVAYQPKEETTTALKGSDTGVTEPSSTHLPNHTATTDNTKQLNPKRNGTLTIAETNPLLDQSQGSISAHGITKSSSTYPPNHTAAVDNMQELKEEHQPLEGTLTYPPNPNTAIGKMQELKKEHQSSEGSSTYPLKHTAAIGDTQELKEQHQPSQGTSTKAGTYIVPHQTHGSVPALNKPHIDTSATSSIDLLDHNTSSQHPEQLESKQQYVQDTSGKTEKLHNLHEPAPTLNNLDISASVTYSANPSNRGEHLGNLHSKEQSIIYQNGAPELKAKSYESEHNKVVKGLDNRSQSIVKSSP